MRRLFIALDLPPRAIEVLTSLEVDRDVWRVLRPETLHVTLAFLGPRPAEDIAAITPIITAKTNAPAPRLAFRKVVRLGQVVAVDLDEQGLGELQATLSRQLEQAGVYTPEKRRFRAHVTVGRLRPRASAPTTVDMPLQPLSFHGTAVTLYASQLHPGGARYEALATARLAIR